MTKPPVKIWRYVVPSDEHREGWGIILMDSTGFFGAVSDYGNYSYFWNAHGREDFRLFVAGLERSWDYAATKLGGYEKNHVFDREATAKGIKKEVLSRRRNKSFTFEEAREEWEQADSLERDNITVERWAESTSIDDPSEYMEYRRAIDLEAFCKKLLPRLAAMIREEMKGEQAVQVVSEKERPHDVA
jgi:hypothetical protein